MSNSVEYEIAMNMRQEALAEIQIQEKGRIIKHLEAARIQLLERIEELEEETKSQKLMYKEEIQEIAYAVNIWPSDLQQLQWSPGGLKDAIIEKIKSGVGRDEFF